jgi:hypothetical protein
VLQLYGTSTLFSPRFNQWALARQDDREDGSSLVQFPALALSSVPELHREALLNTTLQFLKLHLCVFIYGPISALSIYVIFTCITRSFRFLFQRSYLDDRPCSFNPGYCTTPLAPSPFRPMHSSPDHVLMGGHDHCFSLVTPSYRSISHGALS